MTESDFCMPFIIGYGLLLSSAVPLRLWDGVQISQVPVESVRTCVWVLRLRGALLPLTMAVEAVLPSTCWKASAPRITNFSKLNSPRPYAPLSTLNLHPRE